MHLDDRQWAGLSLFGGTAEFAIGLTIAEEVYPRYTVSGNYISDLGVGTAAAAVFNGSIIILGLLILLSSWFVWRAYRDRILMVSLALTGIGAVGVGVFTESFGGIHSVVSLIAFVFSALSAILSIRIVHPPLGYLSILLGLVSFVSLGLFVSGTYLGLGYGGMERMIVWPVLAWGIALGGYLLGTAAPSPPASAST